MSFSRAIGRQPPETQAIVIGCPLLEQPATGWDVLRETLWLPDPYFITCGSTRSGPQPQAGTFIVQDLRTVDWKGGRPIVEITSLGIALSAGKDAKWDISWGISEDLSLASGLYIATPTIWRAGYPRVTKLYVSLTTPDVDAHVGVPDTPAELFGLPSGDWSMAWTAADDWVASGWIGETRVPQRLPGSAACLVTDTWLYDTGMADRDGIAPGIIYL